MTIWDWLFVLSLAAVSWGLYRIRCRHEWLEGTTLIPSDIIARKCKKCGRIDSLVDRRWVEWHDPPKLVFEIGTDWASGQEHTAVVDGYVDSNGKVHITDVGRFNKESDSDH